MGRYILSVAEFAGRRGDVARYPSFSASIAEWAFSRKCPNLSDGGIRLPFTEDGARSLAPPVALLACKAAALGDARDGVLSGPVEDHSAMASKFGPRVGSANPAEIGGFRQWQFASPTSRRRSFGASRNLPGFGSRAPCTRCWGPHEKLRADLLFLNDIIALHVMDVSSKNSPLIPVRSENAQEVRAVFSILRIGICEPPKCIQTDE